MAITIEKDLELVLRAPQHYHVEVIAYEGIDGNGVFQWSTAFTLLANDVPLAVERAKKISGKGNAHVRTVTQCADPTHLEGLEDLERKRN